jgi:hypothetical protein
VSDCDYDYYEFLSKMSTFSTNFTFSASNGVSITCTVTSSSSNTVVDETSTPSPAPARLVAASAAAAAVPGETSEAPIEVSNDNDESEEGDWETEDDEEESVISEDDRDPVLARLKKRRLATIEKAEREVVAREALDLSSAECLICLTNPRTVAVVPCGHIIACDPCSKKLTEMIKHSDGFSTADCSKCPTCRGDVRVLLKLYA